MAICIRPLNPQARDEIELVAARMRLTLIEVLGEERGTAMYSMDWLVDRVLFHLDPHRCEGEIFLAIADTDIAGHCIVRKERDEAGHPYGLFSTTYIDPAFRRQGLASEFLISGENWMRARGLHRAATNTGLHNDKLIQLYHKHGYAVVFKNEEMLQLARNL